jgi:hypoxanthine phosphoribosyltransferase|tara:strand:- start:1086 stop:1625 length:540 start_codon:yes stop_codon:yes gene_type:complete
MAHRDNTMTGDFFVNWDTYNKTIEELAVQIYEDGYEFNQIVCIAKGGLRVGDILARIFDVPFAVMSVESYHGDGVKDEQGQIVFGNSLAKTTPNLGNKVLLVDDLADSGRTLEKCVKWLEHFEGFFIDDLRTATLWTKGLSTFTPDYYVEFLPNNPWIHQPFERYEDMSVEELQGELNE